MTRRMFVGAVAGMSVRGEHLVLEAIAAERMPCRLVVSGVARFPFFELRDYEDCGAEVMGVLNRHGLRVVRWGRGRFLFAFETLAAREAAWREVSADAEWLAIGRGLVLREVAVYRTL